MGTSYTKGGFRRWLETDPDQVGLNKHYRRSIKYYRALYQAWPEWCANHPGFAKIYKEAKRLRSLGHDVQVDHIIPVFAGGSGSRQVASGLHVPWNLQIISRRMNLSKGNRWWPKCPWDNHELFDTETEPFQLGLVI